MKRKLTSMFWGVIGAYALTAPLSSSFGQSVDPRELATLNRLAQANGSVAVHVAFEGTDFRSLTRDRAGALKIAQQNADSLMRELSGHILSPISLVGEFGGLDFIVTPQGLEILKSSRQVRKIIVANDWHESNLIADIDLSLSAINKALSQNGSAVVEVTLAVDGSTYDIDRMSGVPKLVISDSFQESSAKRRSVDVLNSIGISDEPAKQFGKNLLVDSQRVDKFGVITVNVDRPALATLARDPNVLAIKPVGYVDPRPQFFDPAAFEMAKSRGTADVLIQLRLPYVSGKLSEETKKAHIKSNSRMLTELLAKTSGKLSSELLVPAGAIQARLSLKDLDILSRSGDARLRGFSLNQPRFSPSLNTSIPFIRAANYWPSGFNGAGQTIVIVDSGIEKSHQMLSDVNGNSRVVYEACLQSDNNNLSTTCSPTNAAGDAFNIPGVGAPWPISRCPEGDFRNRWCSHGTHVAGIAAGRAGAFNGMAPLANIASFQVFTPFGSSFGIYDADLLGSVAHAASTWGIQNGHQPYIINMSLGGAPTSVPSSTATWINHDQFAASLTTLTGAGIPVIAAMGNQGRRSAMDTPASVNGVIKVGALINNNVSNQFSDFSNRVNPIYWGNETILFAPGGSTGAGINSSAAYTTTNYTTIEGTSQATPHISGLYAMLKSFAPTASISDVTNFIKTAPLVYNVTDNACPPNVVSCLDTVTVPGIRLP